jgi:hypothetical protein
MADEVKTAAIDGKQDRSHQPTGCIEIPEAVEQALQQ